MKRHIFLLLFALIGMSAMAQYSNPGVENEPIDIRGSRVFVDGFKLDKYNAAACFSSIDGVDMSAEYLKYRAGYKTGLGLTIGGASLAVVGFGTAVTGYLAAYYKSNDGKDYSVEDTVGAIGVVSVVAGAACVLAGIPTICVYKARLNRLEDDYNTSLRIGASPGGLSMAISF
jgi:hypothetical protein